MVVDTIQTCLQAVPALVQYTRDALVLQTHPPFASRAYQPHTYTSSSHIGQAPQPPDYPSPLQLPRSQHHPGYVIPKREEDSYVDETIANMAPSQQQLHNYHMQSEPAMASLSTSMTMYHPGHNYAYQPSPLSPSPGASWPNGHQDIVFPVPNKKILPTVGPRG
ncbi:hypothetical protein SISSUDRAFT_688005 [Sistotremastrum suecicum HHB10207 ss-3]|uniref:Uncharacterized protein n=1 Tax=Sistotremastrum suecicum HHB10207 ss-3 TaxID=1314776 RepID=A0A166I3A6_9AGAM|nr:hypothetical protein SISSUDRAFT_688005 [Sistotremastrum suecicum HHB10207 ss-3]